MGVGILGTVVILGGVGIGSLAWQRRVIFGSGEGTDF